MAFIDVVKILFVPAIIAAGLYGLISYVLLPLIRNHRERYSQYLPLDSVSRHTEGLRDRISDLVMRLVVPRRQEVVGFDGEGRRASRSGSGDEFFSDGEGDRMAGFDAERIDRTVRGGDVEASR
ncbi:hypothetical protein Slin15195_G027320 [Septoria linicola]|uniref:Uncharacterized protein n=1 Tax=Septoria linicola TaxID=215465 RepID=A0A9Q9EHL1_9PEZI|nr:hypothetical protein Slin15195_G027320 [Septoria linicola]